MPTFLGLLYIWKVEGLFALDFTKEEGKGGGEGRKEGKRGGEGKRGTEGREEREHLQQRPLDICPQMSANNQSEVSRETHAFLHDCVCVG